jgi:hypothetical protein
MTEKTLFHPLAGAAARIVAFVVPLLLAAPQAARADVVLFEFQGVVTDNTANLGVFGPFGTVDLGDVITGHISYDTGLGNPDQEPGDPNLGVYDLLDFVIDQAVVGITPLGIGVQRVPPIPNLDPNAPPDLGDDLFRAAGSIDIGGMMFIVGLTLGAPYGAVFADDSLPVSLALSDFTAVQHVRAIRVLGLEPGTSQIDAAQLTEPVPVPEPTLFMLLSLGMCGVGLRQFRSSVGR